MNPAGDHSAWQTGYESGIDEAIRLVDSLRGAGASNLAAPILLRIRAELIAIREDGPNGVSMAA